MSSGPNAGRVTDVLNRDLVADRLFDYTFKDACCSQDGGDCTLYTSRRPLIPRGPPPPPPPTRPPDDPPRFPMRIPPRPRPRRRRFGFFNFIAAVVFGKLHPISLEP